MDIASDIFVVDEVLEFLAMTSFIYNFSNVTMIKEDVLRQTFPQDWLEFLRQMGGCQELKQHLADEGNGEDKKSRSVAPDTFKRFVHKRHQLVTKLEAVLNIQDFHPENCDSPPVTLSKETSRGMSPKKVHEVRRFASFLQRYRPVSSHHQPSSHVVDIGAGLGYLGQCLSDLGYTVHALERDQGHSRGAGKRSSEVNNLVFSLYDSPESRNDLNRLLASHPQFTTISLHACGDLSPAILKWFTTSDSKSTQLFLVSCCYHKMTPSSFPLSQIVSSKVASICDDDASSSSPITSHFALRLASQEPFERWLDFEESEHAKRGQYLGFRCLVEAMELEAGTAVRKVKRKAVRKTQMENYEDFVDNALSRFEFVSKASNSKQEETEAIRQKLDAIYERHKSDFGLFEMVVGLQGFVQKILEYLVLLDRKLYLCSQSGGLPNPPEIVKLFDPLLSPRCYAIHCSKDL